LGDGARDGRINSSQLFAVNSKHKSQENKKIEPKNHKWTANQKEKDRDSKREEKQTSRNR
jgi:ribosomal protein L24E